MFNNKSAQARLLEILCLALLVTAVAAAETPREIAKKAMPSVVLLVMEDSNGQPLAMGSGFAVSEGVIATNMHVIEGAARGYAKTASQTIQPKTPRSSRYIEVPLHEEPKRDIRGIVASDPLRDLVLLSVDGMKLPALSIGDSSEVAVGDAVYAIGNPRGLEGTFSAGIVSGVRNIGEDTLLQITAPISPGSSGGPVVNSKGEVIGVAVATFKGGQNLNFAIPSSYLSSLISAIATPVDLSKAAAARNTKPERSILDGIGGRSTEGVHAAQFAWASQFFQDGEFTFSLRNRLREPVQDIYCLVIFYDKQNQPLDVAVTQCRGIIPAGLAKRVRSEVDPSTKRLTTPVSKDNRFMSAFAPSTRLEFRILYFDVVSPDEPMQEHSAAPREPTLSTPGDEIARASNGAARVAAPASLDEVNAQLRRQEQRLEEAERRLAEAVAKLYPAGDGPDLIESRIEAEFEGWEGDTIFTLANGQIWQQVTFGFFYTYRFRPKVWIIKTHGAYKMKVDGVSSTIFVKRLE
jgi:S1-C subfamily serine protease